MRTVVSALRPLFRATLISDTAGMRKVNLEQLEIAYDDGSPDGYRVGACRFGPLIGATALGATVYELQEGQSICPYHYEYGCEEWAIVLTGRPTLRHPDGEDVLEPGDVVCFPEGPAGAHKFTNTGSERARVMLLSDKPSLAMAVYPDSDKIGIFPPERDDKIMVRRESGVEYFDREL
jgi:uncharacterized cupin superfamily protein